MIGKREIHMIGNAHLDPVWLWRWQEGYAEIKATFRSALDRMNEFPEFVFTCAGAAYYRWIEDNAPDMFEEIRRRVDEGRWVIVGGWWIQPDCNLPAGESFVRHALYSQRYFQEKFGRMAEVGYNVDSFGHHAMLPQLLQKSGMSSYVYMRPNEREKRLDKHLFWWESADGSRVAAFRIDEAYNSPPSGELADKIARSAALAERHGIPFMCFYGVGNHGGGPTKANIRSILAHDARPDGAAALFSSPNRFFERVRETDCVMDVVRDDLQHHASGCYSAHSETKANNRRAERRLYAAETFSSIAHATLAHPYPAAQLRQGWEYVLFNQFHDIMGGCSIREAYDDARESFGAALQLGAETLNAALQRLSWAIDTTRPGITSPDKRQDWQLWEQDDAGVPLVVFNPLSWEVAAPVQVTKALAGIADDAGNAVPHQAVRASRTNGADKWDTLFVGLIPAMGYRVYWLYRNKVQAAAVGATAPPVAAAEPFALENAWLRLEVAPHTGHISRLLDKRHNLEVFDGTGAVPLVIDEHDSDTWSHGLFAFRSEIGRFADAAVTMLEQGPLRSALRVTSRYNQSTLRQDFMLYADRPEVHVSVQLDWREKHKMLKLSFPVRVTQPTATYEIPFGFIARATDGNEQPGQQWLDVSGALPEAEGRTYGLALLNNAKYSYDVSDNDMRMTVVRSPMYADHYGERDDLAEYMDQGLQQFRYALVPHAGAWQEAGIGRKAIELNTPAESVIETYHPGPLSRLREGIRLDGESVDATALKKSEDEKGYVLRCFETAGREASATIRLPLLDRTWTASFGKNEIKSFFIPLDREQPVTECNLLELEARRDG